MVIATQRRLCTAAGGGGGPPSTTGLEAKLANMFLDGVESPLDSNSIHQAAERQHQQHIGITVRRVLVAANGEERAVVGLSESITALSKTPDDFLFCVLADGSAPASHMHQVLLEAFCFEHDIYIIKVDSAEKLSRMLGTHRVESCALVQKGWRSVPAATDDYVDDDAEEQLVDYCEEHWENPVKPIVKLPEK